MFHRDRFHWFAFAAVFAGGVLLAMVVDFVCRYPIAVAAIALAAYAFTREVRPFTAVSDLLRHRHQAVARWTFEYGIPAVVVGGAALAVWVNFAVGARAAFLVLTVLYLSDRIAAWLMVRGEAMMNARRRERRDAGDWRLREPAQARVWGDEQ